MATLREKLAEINRMIKEQEETANKIVMTTEKIGEDVRGANHHLEVARG